MKRAFLVVMFVLSLVVGCTTPKGQGIEIRDAWIRPATQGANGAVYFTVQNYSATDDEITGVSAEVAEAAEIHESVMNGDVMQMHQLPSLPLPAGEEVAFEPGGLHIMLVNLKQDLNTGDEIEIILRFKNSVEITLPVPVRETPASEEHPANRQ